MVYLECIILYKYKLIRGAEGMNGEMDKAYMRELATKYKQELTPLLRYLSWLEQNAGNKMSTTYNGLENGNNTMSFPIYDSTLLSFIKEASKTSFMDKNYAYIYSRYNLKTPEQERALIEKATMQDWNVLCGILTRYVKGGMTQSYLWTQGMTESILYLTLAKMKEVVEFWDRPLSE